MFLPDQDFRAAGGAFVRFAASGARVGSSAPTIWAIRVDTPFNNRSAPSRSSSLTSARAFCRSVSIVSSAASALPAALRLDRTRAAAPTVVRADANVEATLLSEASSRSRRARCAPVAALDAVLARSWLSRAWLRASLKSRFNAAAALLSIAVRAAASSAGAYRSACAERAASMAWRARSISLVGGVPQATVATQTSTAATAQPKRLNIALSIEPVT